MFASLNGRSKQIVSPTFCTVNSVTLLLIRHTHCCGRRGPADRPGEYDDGDDVGDHAYELRGERLAVGQRDATLLNIDLYRLRQSEQEGRAPGTQRRPFAEDEGCQRDEAAPRG